MFQRSHTIDKVQRNKVETDISCPNLQYHLKNELSHLVADLFKAWNELQHCWKRIKSASRLLAVHTTRSTCTDVSTQSQIAVHWENEELSGAIATNADIPPFSSRIRGKQKADVVMTDWQNLNEIPCLSVCPLIWAVKFKHLIEDVV